MRILANIRNGLAFPHDGVCNYQSNHGHHMKTNYFRIDAMSYDDIIYLLKGGTLKIVDGTGNHKKLTDAQKFGVPTWCIVFNRALDFKGSRHINVCDWQTPEMKKVALSDVHKPLVQSIRKLVKIYGHRKPAIIGDNILLECHHIDFDDKPERLKKEIIDEILV